MGVFKIYKRRAGQSFVFDYNLDSTSIDEAKKEFVSMIHSWLLEGKMGCGFVWLSEIIDNVDEDGIYYNNEIVMSDFDLHEGISQFTECVYTWRIQELLKFESTSRSNFEDVEECLAIDISDANYILSHRGIDEYTIKECKVASF